MKLSFLIPVFASIVFLLTSCATSSLTSARYEEDDAYWTPGEIYGKPEMLSGADLKKDSSQQDDFYSAEAASKYSNVPALNNWSDYNSSGSGITPMWDPVMGWRLGYQLGNWSMNVSPYSSGYSGIGYMGVPLMGIGGGYSPYSNYYSSYYNNPYGYYNPYSPYCTSTYYSPYNPWYYNGSNTTSNSTDNGTITHFPRPGTGTPGSNASFIPPRRRIEQQVNPGVGNGAHFWDAIEKNGAMQNEGASSGASQKAKNNPVIPVQRNTVSNQSAVPASQSAKPRVNQEHRESSSPSNTPSSPPVQLSAPRSSPTPSSSPSSGGGSPRSGGGGHSSGRRP